MISSLINFYAKAGKNKKIFFRILIELIRRFLMMIGDPAYEIPIHGKKMILPASHKLPIYVADYPFYDTLPTRISTYLRERDGFLSMVDIGANVGDTVLACFEGEDDRFLAVEANPDFVKYLKSNTSRIKHFKLVEAFCHSGSSQKVNVQIESANGTARVREGEGVTIPKKTLDEIINETVDFGQFNFLKIDTDGNDFDVLKGAHQFISKVKPTILMECDIFDNGNYIRDLSDTMKFLALVGYSTVVVYDNLGNLFNVFEIKDFVAFKYPLFYQLVSQFGYFDLLILQPVTEEFIHSELAYFVGQITNPDRNNAARDALEL